MTEASEMKVQDYETIVRELECKCYYLEKYIQALVASSSNEPVNMHEWRPIAEAPLDLNRIVVGKWRNDGVWVMTVAAAGVKSDETDAFDGSRSLDEATHFVLLPPPPMTDVLSGQSGEGKTTP